jgi:SRSO17 transposase
MERRFQARLQELLADAEVPIRLLQGVLPRLETFLQPFLDTLTSPEQRTNATQYVQGLLSDLQGKDVESIAYLHDRERQGLQKFIGQHPWQTRPLLDQLATQVGQRLGQPDGVLVFDPSSFPKQGTESVGVARQWCGRLGKVDNCQVGIYLGYVSRIDHALVDFRLYLPREWTRDRRRLRKAGVPPEVGFATRHELALDLLDQHAGELPHAWVAGDDEMGRNSWFRQQLHARGESYLLAVPSNTLVRDLVASAPPSSGSGRKRRTPLVRAERWRATVPEASWETIEVRDGEKGPLVVQAVRTLVQARTEGQLSCAAETLVVFRQQQSDGTWKHDYLLSNAIVPVSLAEFARVYQAEHRIEESLKRAKSEAGLGGYQVRTWEGWHHHQTLSLLATWFLVEETRRGKKNDAGVECAASAGADRRAAEWEVKGPQPRADSTHDEPPFASQRRSPLVPLATTQPLATATL